MPKELRMNVEFTHPETGELQRANVSPFHLSPFNRTTLTQARKGRNPLAHGLTVRPGYVDTHQGETRVKNALWSTGNVPH